MAETLTKLSVNLNKLALLRNQRDVGYPSIIDHAKIILEAGAHGLTVHPRPDERHIRHSDIPEISAFLADWSDQSVEFNIEGYPSDNFIELVLAHSCHQVTLVPDDPDQRTSDHGWDVKTHFEQLKNVIKKLKDHNKRVSVFIDPVPELISRVAETGADRVELYTGPYAENEVSVETYAQSAIEAKKAGLGVNAGHDLSLENLARFIFKIPNCAEVSIGHAITADALKMGWNGAVTAYLTALEYGHKMAASKTAKAL
ncbi:MAG TPA: pyridoxine 5'-phosphate synthase [Alphaproteobacteria bacterium]|nr:pyridoxine 5'-phosphate synthase [Alphaproteobacteria bacterium]